MLTYKTNSNTGPNFGGWSGGATYTQTNYVDGDVGMNISSGTGRGVCAD